MSWLFGGGPPKSPRHSRNDPDEEITQNRLTQLSYLEKNIPGIVRRANDGSLYEVPFKITRNGDPIVMRLFFSARFPVEKPVLQLLSPVKHPWVNRHNQVVGHPDLAVWHGMAGKPIIVIVTEVINEFRKDAAKESDQMQRTVSYNEPDRQNSLHPWLQKNYDNSRSEMAVGVSKKEEKPKTPIPPIPSSFEELEKLSNAELQRLNDDDIALASFVEKMSGVQRMKSLLGDLRVGNAETAKSNMSRSQEIDELREEIQVSKVILRDISDAFKAELATIDPYAGEPTHSAERAILLDLKGVASAAEKASQRNADEFLAGNLRVSAFLENFMENRVKYHKCSAKLESIKRAMDF